MERNQDITQLGYYLNRAFTGLVDDLDNALRKAGIPLNHSRFSVLQLLSRNDSEMMSQREMSKKLGKDPAAISRTVNHLEKQGFVTRVHVNGCKNGVSLTDKARDLQPAIERIIREVTTDACREMTDCEVNAGLSFLVNLLRKPSCKILISDTSLSQPGFQIVLDHGD